MRRLWRPVEPWCQTHGVKFAYLQDWPGYKSGALNYACMNLIDPRSELIGIIDTVYQHEPAVSAPMAPLFADRFRFHQAPQDYRDRSRCRSIGGSTTHEYFFAVSRPSRDERDGAIVASAMGLIRGAAIERVGGWDKWCVTDDADCRCGLNLV
jgi:hypothetical protein